MPGEAREVTTFCPRCGKPIVWSVARVPAGGAQLAVTAFACRCSLRDEEWENVTGATGRCGRLAARTSAR